LFNNYRLNRRHINGNWTIVYISYLSLRGFGVVV
jgi:hypothetical protein